MEPEERDPLRARVQAEFQPGEFDPKAVRPTSIRLDGDGDCPHCRRPLLGLGAGACAFCETPFGAWLEDLPAALSRLHEMAPGWTPERLRQWLLPRPAQLAWAYETRAWANLGTWMDEDLRGGLARLEMSRRGRGLGTRFDHVEVTAVHLQALGDTTDWAALRVEGLRRAAPYAEEDDEGQEPAPFLEWWSLRPTGRPDRGAESLCRSCGGPIAFEEEHCRHCGAAPVREPGPWLVGGILVQGREGGARRLFLQGGSAYMPRV
ncbi:MAG: hypothetical protein IPL96_07770 [Holophagaceae bacterium]|nr:hypothetical protein [Holophagaceae bacterium]